jgi:hypothetical protein
MCPTFATAPTCVTPTTQATLHGACDPYQGAVAPATECGDPTWYCQVQYTAGIACVDSTTCTQPGAFCDTTAHTCMNPSGGKCESKLPVGSNCDPHNEGFFSFVDNQCADGSQCTQLPSQTKATCQVFASANGTCTTDGQCKVGLFCAIPSGQAAGKCTPWFNDGQSCTSGAQCRSAAAFPGTVCIADNADAGTATTCQVGKSFGASCIPGFEDQLCEPSDLPGTSYCAPSGSGGGSCVPKCF